MIDVENFLVIGGVMLTGFSDQWWALDKTLVEIRALEEKAKLRLSQYNVITMEWVNARK